MTTEDFPKEGKPREVTLFVGNLAFAATEADVQTAFEARGLRVSLVKVSRDPDGEKSRGYGFVTVFTADPDRAISDLYGTPICGRNVRVDYSTSAKTRDDPSTNTTTTTASIGDERWGPKTWTR